MPSASNHLLAFSAAVLSPCPFSLEEDLCLARRASSDIRFGTKFLSKSAAFVFDSRNLSPVILHSTYFVEHKWSQYDSARRSIITTRPALSWASLFATERCRLTTQALTTRFFPPRRRLFNGALMSGNSGLSTTASTVFQCLPACPLSDLSWAGLGL